MRLFQENICIQFIFVKYHKKELAEKRSSQARGHDLAAVGSSMVSEGPDLGSGPGLQECTIWQLDVLCLFVCVCVCKHYDF